MKKDDNKNLTKLKELTELIKKLRAPDGCPWDQQQKKEDISKYILEEAYEVADSLAKENPQALKEELGDLLFQILFLTEIGTELELFSLSDVLDGIIKKMIRRHPHVFGDTKVSSVHEVKENWQQIKKKERGIKNDKQNIFDNVPLSFPALKRAQKITSIAATYGFDWPKIQDVMKKLKEEIKEFNAAIKKRQVDAETALSKVTNKFLQRFSYVTAKLSASGISLEKATLTQMDALWNEAKIKELE
ncbi:MAG: nucleoside triphosphate pyrophosphohydrolase [Deltaproteobacteria bacterium]|nr:nucleoside triphosphate pyrophosphohydrolase [Deltaproteobacteria bacterium]